MRATASIQLSGIHIDGGRKDAFALFPAAMRRIILILVLAIMLLSPRQSAKDEAVVPASLLVNVRPLPLDSGNPARSQVGSLRFLGAWALTSGHNDFGGISAMRITPDGGVLALNDSGTLMGFGVDRHPRRQFIAPLPVRAAERDWPNWKWDSESLAYDPETDRHWVGFELIERICRYAPGFARVESCRSWPEMAAWPKTGGAEAMVRLPDGRFLVFSEFGYAPGGSGNDVLLFAADPAEADTPPPLHLRYRPPQGYRPTDALWLDKDRLVVLNRRVTFQEGFTGTLALVTLPPLRAGAELVAQDIARLAPPLLADNYEAVALSHESGRAILWVASDDNHEFFQRTLLLKFALPDIAPHK